MLSCYGELPLSTYRDKPPNKYRQGELQMNLTHSVFAKNTLLLHMAMVSAIAASAANGQPSSAVSLSLSIDDPRPVAAAAQVLMNRHGLIVTYEDPAYVHNSDVMDGNSQVRRDRNFSSDRVLVPIGGRMDFEYSASGEGGAFTAVPEVVRDLVDYHALGGGAGRFRVSESGDYVHIIPEQVRDSSGLCCVKGTTRRHGQASEGVVSPMS